MWEVAVLVVDARAGETRVTPRAQQLGGWELGVFLQGGYPERYRALLRFAKHLGREPGESSETKGQMRADDN